MFSQIYTFKFKSKILLRYNFIKLIDSVLFGAVTDLLSATISAASFLFVERANKEGLYITIVPSPCKQY